MPNFGSSLQPSGRAGSFCKLGGGQRRVVLGVGWNGIGNMVNDDNTVVINGVGPNAIGKRCGPKPVSGIYPQVNSQKWMFRGNFNVTVQAVDATDTPVVGARMELNDSRNDVEYSETISDGSGYASFTVPYNSVFWQVIGYQVGSPDIAGVTRDDLVATWNGN